MKPNIELLDPPETIPAPGGTVTLTHKVTILKIDPRAKDAATVVTVMKGFMVEGQFQDYGPHVTMTMDAMGTEEMLANADPALSDIPKAMAKRAKTLADSEDAKRAADEAAEQERTKGAREAAAAKEAEAQRQAKKAAKPEPTVNP